jgi:hypothetical protein
VTLELLWLITLLGLVSRSLLTGRVVHGAPFLIVKEVVQVERHLAAVFLELVYEERIP